MKGQVLDFSVQTNSGIITTPEGSRFKFDGSQWKAAKPPVRGMTVDFEPKEDRAVEIYHLAINESANSPRPTNDGDLELSDKSRTTYIILALFLGGLGIHNFYVERTGIAVAQLLLGLLSCGLVSIIWSTIDAFTVTHDGHGRRLA